MNIDPRIPSLVLRWQELRRQGRLPTVAELCAGCPELCAAVGEQIRTLLAGEALLVSPSDLAATVAFSPAATEGAVPEQAGRFQLLGEIARGGMGAVLRGHDPELGRDLAVKVILPAHHDNAAVLRRFLDEARLAGQLQHPGVAPVYDLGRLPDGRPFFAMKLIEGHTLAELLRERTDPSHDLPRFLKYFEAVCQTVGYAHARGILHRDLKPLNVMVGAFGEVQVMDWGLAKQLRRGPETADAATMPAVGPSGDGAVSQAGSVIGTPAYMPPEQALGQTEQVDARSDVFGLGAMLCEMLTGLPPFRGATIRDVMLQSSSGDLSDAYARLNTCGAEAELVRLAKACLSPKREDRPADGSAVAAGVAAYLNGVQERLRQAEIGRARAEEERKRRRMQLALTLVVLFLVLVGGGGAWLFQQQRQAHAAEVARQRREADTAASAAMAEARLLLDQAQADPVKEAGRFQQALAAARKAEQLAQTGAGSDEIRHQAAQLAGEIGREEVAAHRDLQLLAELLEVRGPREGPRFQRDERGAMAELAQPSADERFVAAFRSWGLDVDATTTAEAAARLRGRPAAVLTEIIAALDEWTSERRRRRLPAATWQRLTDLAQALDGPDSRRRELRTILVGDKLERERALGVVALWLRPVPIPFDAGPGVDRERLRRLAAATDAATEPVLGLLTLTRALRVAGDEAVAERLLRGALCARPQEVVLHQALGQLLEESTPPRWGEAVVCYAAARVLRPALGDALAKALVQVDRGEEGLALYQRLSADQPNNPWLPLRHGWALVGQRRFKEAEAMFREAIRRKPDYFLAHYNLGFVLRHQKRAKEAEAAGREAIRLNPGHPLAHNNLGVALMDQGRIKEAEAAFRNVIRLDTGVFMAHSNLGVLLVRQGRFQEAEAECRLAIREKPDYPEAHSNLAGALGAQGRFSEAEAAGREAIRLKPDYSTAHQGLGVSLASQHRFKEAAAAFREAIRLNPDYFAAYFGLGSALLNQDQHPEAEAAYREALRLKPDFPEVYCNLAGIAEKQGRFTESLEGYRRGHALGSKSLGWSYPSAQWVRVAERLVELDRQLAAVLQGEAEPATAVERLEFASFCQHPAKRLHAAAARLTAVAFAADPKLANDFNKQYRYYAARSAALAAAGQAEDARNLPDKVAVGLRRQALQWLRADLTVYARLAVSGNVAKEAVRQRLTSWQADADFLRLRDQDALEKLSESERQEWQKLWADVDALGKRVGQR